MFGLFKKRNSQPKYDPSQIVPRIKNVEFVAALEEAGVPQDQLPVTEPLAGDLIVTYAFDLPDSFEMVTRPHLAELGVEPGALRELAVDNLRRQIPQISLQQSGSLFRAVTGNNMDACTLLSQSLWEERAKSMAGSLIAAVPSRDFVIFCDSTSEDGMHELQEFAAGAFAAAENHALTPSLLRWTGAGWQAYSAEAD